MGHILNKGGANMEKGDTMFGRSRGGRFLQRIAKRKRFHHIHESNPKTLGGEEAEERKIPCHGNF